MHFSRHPCFFTIFPPTEHVSNVRHDVFVVEETVAPFNWYRPVPSAYTLHAVDAKLQMSIVYC